MVSIRLSRTGKKNHATFRFIVSDKQRDTVAPALEILGWYDPHTNPGTIEVKADRVQYWLSKGAQASPSAHNLLVTAGVIKADKVVVAKAKKKDEPKVEEKPAAAPKAEAPKAEEKKEEAPANAEEPKIEVPKAEVKPEEKKEEAPATEAPKAEEKKAEETKN
ncbi:MAG: 30S ribosomal protein S16 [Patescibacteria group bacterium]|jgi:small subunit ribosomal protein S16